MQELKIQHVQLHPGSLRDALKAVDAAISTNSEIKSLLERLLGLQKGPRTKTAATPGRARGGRRPRGEKTLRMAIVEVLQAAKRPLKPIELKQQVLDSGYRTSATPQSFYTAVFNTARKEPGIVKTEAGFEYKGGGEAASGRGRGRPRKRGRKPGARGPGRPRTVSAV